MTLAFEKDVTEKCFTMPCDIVLEKEHMINCFPNRPSSAFIITNESPPIWFRPLEVFEVLFADMTLSRQHTAAAGILQRTEERGVALRFPRFNRRRPDKRSDQANTTLQIAQLFANQTEKAVVSPKYKFNQFFKIMSLYILITFGTVQ